ncbi:MAG: type I restriction-modification system subunit M [Gammaproteobacteria bacterium]|nr:type I restriction-modification system subunit M [Gammaproteobacteria bacterium]MBU1481162.1 type I restriction-modification system subunit M [Gammaproteobacteria bacterium]
MAIKKSELYSSLWSSCDELRGGMDASQYKDYVLVLLFVKYVSDKYAGDPNALINVPAGGSFADMVAAKEDKEIGDKLNKIIGKLATANPALPSAKDFPDFNAEDKLGKAEAMVDRLTKLVAIFESMDFGRNRAEGDDLLGDAYEFLMRHFATESGKSKGQFYTPAEVSRIMSMVIDLGSASDPDQSIYDPTCGSGSLLLKAHDEAKSRTGLDLALYGQEMDNATSALARMNMVLHDCPTAEIWQDNTLSHPYFKNADGGLKTFDYVVANPPFSNKNWTSGLDAVNDLYGRFEYGIPPDKNGDYAFLLHMLKSLKSTGKAAVILPHGVLFRGGAESDIRTRIIKHGYIKGIIGLPPNLFYGTGIPACIIVLDKAGAAGRKGIFMIDASKGYIKDGNKNRLRAQDIHKIVDTFTRQVEMPKYARMVPLDEIADPKNGFNLNLPRYIDSSEAEDLQDIEAHLKGGIPNRDIDGLAPYWQVFPKVRGELFSPLPQAGEGQGERVVGYCQPKVEPSQVKATIFSHPEFTAFNQRVTQLFAQWIAANAPLLSGIKQGDRPKMLIETLSENLLDTFRSAPLIDPYDVYQHLMDYWAATMQDDVWVIASDGWEAARVVRQLLPTKDKNGKPVYREEHDFVFDKKRYKADLIPPALIIARYFAAEQAAIEKMEAAAAALEQQMEEMREEHGGDDGLLFEVMEDGKISKAAVKDRLKTIKGDKAAADERKVLEAYADLVEQEAAASRQVKDAQQALATQVAAQYAQLTEAEIKTLVVDDKWLAALAISVQGELDRVSQTLTGRIKQLAERYATPLPELVSELETLSARVEEHLKKMGFAA